MKPVSFEYERPTSLDAALGLLAASQGSTKIIAGGQSLVPMMNFRFARPDRLVDINRIRELDYHRLEGDELAIGALARHAALKDSDLIKRSCPLMSEAYEWVAHRPILNRGTLCGNLCHADPASEMPAVVQAVNATLVLRNRAGARKVPATEFFTGIYATASRDDEMLVEVRIPVAPKGQGWGFHEVSVRKGDFAITAASATLTIAKGQIATATIALAGIGSHAQRMGAAERALIGKPVSADLFVKCGEECAKSISPSTDIHGDAEYRRDLVRSLVSRALKDASERCT
jgi:carbon-monoxide dehydrogenase medium subunit